MHRREDGEGKKRASRPKVKEKKKKKKKEKKNPLNRQAQLRSSARDCLENTGQGRFFVPLLLVTLDPRTIRKKSRATGRLVKK